MEQYKHNGTQRSITGAPMFDIYTDAVTGGTFCVKPGENVQTRLEEKRAEFEKGRDSGSGKLSCVTGVEST